MTCPHPDDPRSFVLATDRRYLWHPDYSEPGYRLVGGRCTCCGSDLAIELPVAHPVVTAARVREQIGPDDDLRRVAELESFADELEGVA